MAALRGSCLCQAIAYEVDQLDMPISHCHCHTCRKAHAAAFASTAGVMREHFRWTQGEQLLASLNPRPASCGISVRAVAVTWSPNARPSPMIVRVATLDDDPGATPEAHIWMSHAVPWLADRDLPECAQWQPAPER